MYESGKCANVVKEMKNYQLEILVYPRPDGLKQDKQILPRMKPSYNCIYSGNKGQNSDHTKGVGIMMTSRADKSLIGWEPVNERMILVRFTATQPRVTLTVITCYSPKNEADEELEAKEEFYEVLQNTITNRSKREILHLMGDFNAKVGNDNTGYREIMGRHGVGDMNENGQHLADFCASIRLVIGGTLFPHKKIHKTTCQSPDKKIYNLIEYIYINTKFRRSLLDLYKSKARNGCCLRPLLSCWEATAEAKHKSEMNGR